MYYFVQTDYIIKLFVAVLTYTNISTTKSQLPTANVMKKVVSKIIPTDNNCNLKIIKSYHQQQNY